MEFIDRALQKVTLLVETGEASSLPETRYIERWLSGILIPLSAIKPGYR
jgi:hypothetical protein